MARLRTRPTLQPNVTRPPGYAGPRTGSVQATMTADGVPLASWWWRVLAVLIDNLITQRHRHRDHLPGVAIALRDAGQLLQRGLDAQRSGVTPPTLNPTDLISGTSQLILTSVTLVVGMLYHVGFLRWKSATPGKLICGLRVVPVDRGRDPGPLAWSSIFIRAAIWVLPGISSFLSLDHPRGCALSALAPEATGAARYGREDAGRAASLSLAHLKVGLISRAKNPEPPEDRSAPDYIEPRSERSGRSYP